MKRLSIIAALLIIGGTASATVTINLGAANLYFSDGMTLAPQGSLVQLIVSSTDNVFSSPTPTSFTGDSTDDFVLYQGAINQGDGGFLDQIIFSLSGTISAGDSLLLRWFPSLSASATAPGIGTQYGQFRTDVVEDPFSDTAWIVPSDGSTISLTFLTMAQGGPHSEAEGAANLVVVPEPSTYALMAVGLAGLVVAQRRRKQNAA